MTIFDLIFLLTVLSTAFTVLVLIGMVIRGRRRGALKTLSVYAICAAIYLCAGMAFSFARPQRVMNVGDSWCFDDWCLAVDKIHRTPEGADMSYQIGMRIFSRAGRVWQRANGAWIYLIDDQNRRYAPEPQSTDIPLDTLLGPGQSVATSRTFRVPVSARPLGVVTGHGGAYCGPMSLLIIGNSGCLFGKAPMIRIP